MTLLYLNRYIRVFKLKKVKNKTALAELIHSFNESLLYGDLNSIETSLLKEVISLLSGKLPKEKQDLIEAYKDGLSTFEYVENHQNEAEDYFNQNFEQ